MILTFKIKINRNFSLELQKAKQIAEFVPYHKTRSSKDVKRFDLKPAIANQVLRKHGNNKTIQNVNRIKLTASSQSIRSNKDQRSIGIPCLKPKTRYGFGNDYEKVNQVELNNGYAYVSVTIKEPSQITPKAWIGVDRNTTGHIAVVANPSTGNVWKLGKGALHIHNKYKIIRRDLHKKGKLRLVNYINGRESMIAKGLNHKLAKEIVNIAIANNTGIKLEQLDGIRDNMEHARKFNYSPHGWSSCQLQNFMEYNAKLCGIPLAYVEPKNASKECSRCGNIGISDSKKFMCPLAKFPYISC